MPARLPEGTALPIARRLAFEPSPYPEFNLRSAGMTGPYWLAVGWTFTALTAGAAIVDHYPSLGDQTPAAKVRMIGPGSASSMTHDPIEWIQVNPAGTASGPAWLDLQPAYGKSSASLELTVPQRPAE